MVVMPHLSTATVGRVDDGRTFNPGLKAGAI
jgi:hypothetical protein